MNWSKPHSKPQSNPYPNLNDRLIMCLTLTSLGEYMYFRDVIPKWRPPFSSPKSVTFWFCASMRSYVHCTGPNNSSYSRWMISLFFVWFGNVKFWREKGDNQILDLQNEISLLQSVNANYNGGEMFSKASSNILDKLQIETSFCLEAKSNCVVSKKIFFRKVNY